MPTEVLKPDLSTLAPETMKIITAISEMMAVLVSKVNELEPLNNVIVTVCTPDILPEYSNYFTAAGLKAGLAAISIAKASTSFFVSGGDQTVEACTNTRKSNCDHEEYSFERSGNCNKILSINYSKAALAVTWGIIERDFESLNPHKVEVYFDLGHAAFLRSDRRIEYWDTVRSTLDNIVKPMALGDVLIMQLLGDAASETELLSFLKSIFKENPCLKKGRYLLSLQDHTFRAARSRALGARLFMRSHPGEGACRTHPACPLPDSRERDICDVDGEKDEL
ncbi:hypothetical protein TWF718_000411 [Orbilia javanica]|uniref:Uncharacterized protein n=1 Tax=Orbilia javanica TaxID=47235 RepID=A0AAN8RLY7_9PEZI